MTDKYIIFDNLKIDYNIYFFGTEEERKQGTTEGTTETTRSPTERRKAPHPIKYSLNKKKPVEVQILSHYTKDGQTAPEAAKTQKTTRF